MTEHLIYLSIPGLRAKDVTDAEATPTVNKWASGGATAELAPSFPCVTSTVQASTWTGAGPDKHGVIANGFYHRDRREVEFWVARNGIVEGEQIWDVIQDKGMTSAVWHAQNIKDAAADFIITPEPIHHDDGRMDLWCYSKPDGLYENLIEKLGHFPLQHYWGPLSNIESSKWILAAAKMLIDEHRPNFHYIYLPHLDYESQKFGPDSPQAANALRELDAELADFDAYVTASPIGPDAVFLAVSEYAMTDVMGAVFPNVALAKAGLLKTRAVEDGTLIDFEKSAAFAMVDHQCAHVYVRDGEADKVAALFRGTEGIAGVYAMDERKEIGIDHERAGEVVLVSKDDHWFQYYWWEDENDAPAFTRTVDIHRKPGYDPVELFFDPATKSIPLNASLVRGSHGVPATEPRHRGGIVCSEAEAIEKDRVYSDKEIKSVVLKLLGISAT